MYTDSTQNYHFPQFRDTDKMDPVADFNSAFRTIDAELHKNSLNQVKEFTQEAIAQVQKYQELAERAVNASEAANEAVRGLTTIVTALDANVKAIDKRLKVVEQKLAIF